MLFCDFTRKIGIHTVANFRLVETVTKEKHEFGHCTFGGAVIACLKKFQSGFVASHFNCAALALGDINNNDATFGSFFQLTDEPVFLRGVSGTKGFEYDGFQTGDVENGVDDAFLDAGKEGEHDDVCVEQIMGFHGACRVGTADDVGVVLDVDACMCQRGIIEGTECVEVFGIYLGGTVATHQLILEKDAYFGDNGSTVRILGSSYLDGGDEVFFSISSQGADGELGARENNRFGEVLEHETESGSGIGHGVGSVEDDKAVEVVVVVVDYLDDFCPE